MLMNIKFTIFSVLIPIFLLACSGLPSQEASEDIEVGTLHVKAFDLPPSALMSDESKEAIKTYTESMADSAEEYKKCPDIFEVELVEVPKVRECFRAAYYSSESYKNLRAQYAVDIVPQMMGGVYTEIFTPSSGIADSNENRVLINVHGGSFIGGSRYGGQMESIPISAMGKIKVISIDYRMAPEHRFPAASEDVLAVYRELLKTYKPENIGLYGYSAGGVLTSQSMATFQKEGIPLPGAIAMIAGAAGDWEGGDLMHIGGALVGFDLLNHKSPVSYFDGIDESDPLVRPAKSDEVLSRFPPSLLISATRDFALSNVIHTHRQLVRLGVEADLHIWEGMGHELIAAYYTSEGREAYDVMVDFFEEHLGVASPQ